MSFTRARIIHKIVVAVPHENVYQRTPENNRATGVAVGYIHARRTVLYSRIKQSAAAVSGCVGTANDVGSTDGPRPRRERRDDRARSRNVWWSRRIFFSSSLSPTAFRGRKTLSSTIAVRDRGRDDARGHFVFYPCRRYYFCPKKSNRINRRPKRKKNKK